MKASIKFQDAEKPVVRAKVPISILGLPFSTAVSAGVDATDLRLDLSTSFSSGPAVRVSYRPNDPFNPFSVVLKTGIGTLGSPVAAPMSMSAEFTLLPSRAGPTFSLRLKPRLGDFSVVKSTASSSPPPPQLNGGGGENGGYAPARVNGFVCPAVTGLDGFRFLNGVEVTANSVLPLSNKATAKFRWGVRIPSEIPFSFRRDVIEKKRSPLWVSPNDLPVLVMRKISIEQVPAIAAGVKSKKEDPGISAPMTKNKMEGPEISALVMEQGMLRKAVDELRVEVERWKVGKALEERNGGGKVGAVNRKNGKPEELNGELKKALKGSIVGS